MKNRYLISILFMMLFLVPSITPKSDPHATQPQLANISDDSFEETIFNWSRTLAQVMDIAHKKHYAITDPQENMIKAIDGFVSSLDAHSSFLDKEKYKEMMEMTSGEFYGVGIVIDNLRKSKDKHLT